MAKGSKLPWNTVKSRPSESDASHLNDLCWHYTSRRGSLDITQEQMVYTTDFKLLTARMSCEMMVYKKSTQRLKTESPRTIEKIEYDLEKARRERDIWKTTRGNHQNYEMSKIYVSSLEKDLSGLIEERQIKS
jgi:hypothetical protein